MCVQSFRISELTEIIILLELSEQVKIRFLKSRFAESFSRILARRQTNIQFSFRNH